jgi:hypothetical protein
MKTRKLRAWLIVLAACPVVGLAAALARPLWSTPSAADRPDVPPWMKVNYLESDIHADCPGLYVVRPDPAATACYVLDDVASPAALDSIRPAEDDAEHQRGVVLCVADAPDGEDSPHACRAGDFRLFGDLTLIDRVRPAAEMIQFGPYRGKP